MFGKRLYSTFRPQAIFRSGVILLLCLSCGFAAPPLSAESAAKVKEAQRLNAEVSALYQQGKVREAIPIAKRTVDLFTEVYGEDHEETANALNDLGAVLQATGDLTAARPIIEQALAIKKKLFGPDDPRVALSLETLGVLHYSLKDSAAVRSCFEQSVAIYKKSVGLKNLDTAKSINNLGSVLLAIGDYPAARKNLEESLSIKVDLLGEKHPDVARSLNNVGNVVASMGDFAAARSFFERSLAVRREIFGEKHPDTAESLGNLGALLARMREFDASRPLLKQAVELNRELLGDRNPAVSDALTNLMSMEALVGDVDQALKYADRTRRLVREQTLHVLTGLAPAEQLNFLRRTDENRLFQALTLAVERRSSSAVASMSASWLVNWKGICQETLAERSLLRTDSRDPKLTADVKQLDMLRRQLAAITFSPAVPGREAERLAKLVALEMKEQEMSRRVGRVVGASASRESWIEIDEIRKAVPSNAVLIDIVRVDIWLPEQVVGNKRDLNWAQAHYLAWVVPAAESGEIEIVDLGPAEPIETAIADLLDVIGAAPQLIRRGSDRESSVETDEALAALARLVYKPLQKPLSSAREWLISPDAALWLLPWSALPTADGEYAVENHEVTYFVSGRDLLGAMTPRSAQRSVVVADPDYDLQPESSASTRSESGDNSQRSNDTAVLLRSLAGEKWSRLSGSAAEGTKVQSRLKKYTGHDPEMLSGKAALESSVKAISAPQVFAVSTHGFFMPTKSSEADSKGIRNGAAAVSNPLLCCGLVLAGANRRDQALVDGDDGILSGLEIVGLNLRGTELAVLSACETAVGRLQSGEGVAGLRQAFHLAGVEVVVAGLWQIADDPTAELIGTFFDHLAANQRKSLALARAQREMISAQRAARGFTHPFYWAPFTVTGRN
jgi:CHAT domain-containing protein/tetratricopeptide (TPR) repeat protein